MQPIIMYVYIFITVYGCLSNGFRITIYVSMSSLFSKPSMSEAWINEAYFLIVSKETPTLQELFKVKTLIYAISCPNKHMLQSLPSFLCYCTIPAIITLVFCSFSKEIRKRLEGTMIFMGCTRRKTPLEIGSLSRKLFVYKWCGWILCKWHLVVWICNSLQ